MRVRAALALTGILCALLGCAAAAGDEVGRGKAGEPHFYVREITKGEIVPEEGAHLHFEVPEEPTQVYLEGDRLLLTFDLRDGSSRQVVFVVQERGPSTLEVSCPRSNLEPNRAAPSYDDRRLNEAIAAHAPVEVPPHEWTTFFNDHLSGVFSSDWQLWWGEVPPD
ncbi:MAG: hypothetical protein PVH41_04615 [Anaerolineae bacterium]